MNEEVRELFKELTAATNVALKTIADKIDKYNIEMNKTLREAEEAVKEIEEEYVKGLN